MSDRFSLNKGIFVPKDNGIWSAGDYSPATGTVTMDDGAGRELTAWDLLDGSFTYENLFPRKRYWFLVDQLIYLEKGTIEIEGIFPNYWIKDDGRRVWRDHDGSFRFVPIDFKSRYMTRRKNMEEQRLIAFEKKKATLSARGWTRKIEPNPADANYAWTIFHRGEPIETGTEQVHARAEVTTSKRILALKRSYLTKRTKRQKITL